MATKGQFPNYLYYAVGAITVDGQKAKIEHYNPNLPIKWVVIAKQCNGTLKLAGVVGLRYHKPYQASASGSPRAPQVTLTQKEWWRVLPLLIIVLRQWTEFGTNHWSRTSTFYPGKGKYTRARWVDRRTLRVRMTKYPTSFLRPRYLRMAIDNRDSYLLRFFRRLDAVRINRQRGSEMSATLKAAVDRGKLLLIRELLAEFLPEDDLYALSLLLRHLDPGYRDVILLTLLKSGKLSRPAVRACRRLIRRGIAARFETEAERLLQGNAVVMNRHQTRNGYSVFSYSLGLLIRSN